MIFLSFLTRGEAYYGHRVLFLIDQPTEDGYPHTVTKNVNPSQHPQLMKLLEELVRKWQDQKTPNEPSLAEVLSVLGEDVQSQVSENDPPQHVANLILQELASLGRLEEAQDAPDQMSKEERERLNLHTFLSEYAPRGGWG